MENKVSKQSTFMRLLYHVLSLFEEKNSYSFDHICSLIMEEFVHHIINVLEIFKKQTLYVNKEKCIYGMDNGGFIGFVVSSNNNICV